MYGRFVAGVGPRFSGQTLPQARVLVLAHQFEPFNNS